MAKVERCAVPEQWVATVATTLEDLPECHQEPAWTGTRWRVRKVTVAHLFGGQDQQVRLTFRGEPAEVMAYAHLGDPYFRVGGNSIGLIIDDATDWTEVAEMLIASYCLQAPPALAAQVSLPPG